MVIGKCIKFQKNNCKRNKKWLVYSIVFSLLLSFFSFWKIDFLSLGVGNELDLMNEFSEVNKFFSTSQSEKYKNYYRDNFLFIDIGGNYELINDNNGQVAISNRVKLAETLNILGENINSIDLVVLDLFFKHKSDKDSVLLKAIAPFDSFNKIVIGKYGEDNVFKNNFKNSFGNLLHEPLDNGMLIDEMLIDAYGENLSYLAYKKMNDIKSVESLIDSVFYLEKDSNQDISFFYEKYFPIIFLNDDFIRAPLASNKMQLSMSDKIIKDHYPLYYKSYLLGGNKTNLTKQLRINKLNHNRNIVILGTLSENSPDNHYTAFGRVHGATFVINSLIGLMLQNHHNLLKAWLWMFVFTFLICFIFYSEHFSKCMFDIVSKKLPALNHLNRASNIKEYLSKITPHIIWDMFVLFRDELAAVFIFAALYFIYALFNVIPNVFLTLFIFYINTKILEKVKERTNV